MTTHARLAGLALLLFIGGAIDAHAQLRAHLVVSGLTKPIAFVQHPTRPDVQLVVQQGGRIRVVQNGTLTSTDFLDVSGAIVSGDERGLLGMAFAPDFATSRRFYVNFTNHSGDTVIARFRVDDANPLRANASSRFDLVWPDGDAFIRQPFSNHKGGHLAFGPDGYLYIGLGDGGSGNDPFHNAQDPETLLGKMLRINVAVSSSHPTGYTVPSDNPFVGDHDVLPEIWAFGLRNPWRYSFDDPARGGTGALIIGDVGQGQWEEIDYEPADAGGRNYGWRNREGDHDNIDDEPAFSSPLIDPTFDYSHSQGAAVIGGIVYRGTDLGTTYRGRYFFADFSFGRVRSLGLNISQSSGEASVANSTDHTSELTISQPASFGTDADGEMYIVSLSGKVYRIELAAQDPTPSPTTCTTAAPASGWVCANGNWYPPGMSIPGQTPPPPPPPPPSTTGCATTAPGSNWVCANGNWYPPGMTIPGQSAPPSPPPPPPPPPSSTGCKTNAPGSNWTCANGNWYPPGMTIPGQSTPPPPPPPPPSSTGCKTNAPGPNWTCANGNWYPPGMKIPGQ